MVERGSSDRWAYLNLGLGLVLFIGPDPPDRAARSWLIAA